MKNQSIRGIHRELGYDNQPRGVDLTPPPPSRIGLRSVRVLKSVNLLPRGGFVDSQSLHTLVYIYGKSRERDKMKWVGVTFNPITTMCVFLLR